MEMIETLQQLRIYQISFEAGMEIFHISKSYPKEVRYSLTGQIRCSSRSVSGTRKCRIPKAIVPKLSDSQDEAEET